MKFGRNMISGLMGLLISSSCNTLPIKECSAPITDAQIQQPTEQIYEIKLRYDFGLVSATDISVVQGSFRPSQRQLSETGYSVALYDEERNKVFHEGFDFPNRALIEGFPFVVDLTTAETSVFVPAYDSGRIMDFYYKNCTLVETISLD